LQQRRVDLESRINTIEKDQDVAALGSDEERDQWARIQRMEAALAGAPDTPENAELRERVRLVKGVLYFRLNDSFKARMWQQHRAIKDLDVALHEAEERWIRVDRARKSVPNNTGEFAARVADLKARIDALKVRLAATQQKQTEYLAQLAIHELDEQKTRLAAYQVQARFALASMYDRAANQEETRGEKGAALPKGLQKPGDAPADDIPMNQGAAPATAPDATPPESTPQQATPPQGTAPDSGAAGSPKP
jgi:predicted P-loop ATPase